MDTKRKILLALGAFSAVLVLLEIGGGVYLRWFAGEKSFTRYASLMQLERRYGSGQQELGATRRRTPFSPHRYLGYYPTPGYSRGPNQHGRAHV